MTRRLHVRPTTLLAALPLATMACVTAPSSVTTGAAAIVAAAVADVQAPPPEVASEGSIPERGEEGPTLDTPTGADCEGMPELSCRVGNTKAPNYDGAGRS